MIERLLEKLIGRLKRDPGYAVQSRYSARELCTVVGWRFLQVVRGLRLRVVLRSMGWPAFCGRGVVVEHGYRVEAGRSLILEDHVFVNGLSERGVVFGDNVTVGRDSTIVCTGVIARKGVGVTVGNRSAIGAQSFIGGQGGVTIGDDVIMGPGVRIFSENHEFGSLAVPIRLQGERRLGVVVQDDCWVGAGAVILDGVTVGRGSVIAAGAVVTQSVAPGSVVGGVPARLLRSR